MFVLKTVRILIWIDCGIVLRSRWKFPTPMFWLLLNCSPGKTSFHLWHHIGGLEWEHGIIWFCLVLGLSPHLDTSSDGLANYCVFRPKVRLHNMREGYINEVGVIISRNLRRMVEATHFHGRCGIDSPQYSDSINKTLNGGRVSFWVASIFPALYAGAIQSCSQLYCGTYFKDLKYVKRLLPDNKTVSRDLS